MVDLRDYYTLGGFDSISGRSYQTIGNCKNILDDHSDLIKSIAAREMTHNYMDPATYSAGIKQTKNKVYAKTLELWNNAGYNAGNIGNLGEFFLHTVPELKGLFDNLSTELGITNPQGKITIQPPGSSFPLHIDAFLESYSKTYNVEHSRIKRYCVFLSDWQLGQFFGIGERTLQHWSAGDIITWDNSTPHATANASLSNKLSLNVTGTLL